MGFEEVLIKMALKYDTPATIGLLYLVFMAIRDYLKRKKDLFKERYERVAADEISTQLQIIYGETFVDMRDRINDFNKKGNVAVMVSTINGESPISCGNYLADYTRSIANARKSMEKRLIATLWEDRRRYKKPGEKRDKYLDSISVTMSKIFTQQLGRETGTTACSKLVEADNLNPAIFRSAISIIIDRIAKP